MEMIFFYNCVKYEFRENVVPYSKVRSYIEKKSKPTVFSESYYSSLNLMSDEDIIRLFEKNPIEIKNNSIVGGRHRVYAMIGRLVKNKNYLPINYIKKY